MDKLLTLIFLLQVPNCLLALDQEPSIKDLDWLIGSWDYADQAVKSDYTDTGKRDCRYTLMQKYIVCESEGVTNTGKERNYLFYFNYNKRNERFEMVAVFNDYPGKNLYILDVSKDGYVINLKNHEWNTTGLKQLSEAEITYDGTSVWKWEIRFGDIDPETGVVPISFIDTATRRPSH